MLKHVITLGALASGAAALAQGPAMQPATPAEIVAGMSSCLAAVRPAGVDEAVLLKQGWAEGKATGKDGKALQLPFVPYGRKGGRAMLMTPPPAQRKSLCAVVARVDRTESAPAIANAISAHLRAKPAKADKGGVYWVSDRYAIQLTATGDRTAPSVRVAVVQRAQKAK